MGKRTHSIKAKQEKPQIAKKDEESEEVLNCLEDQIPYFLEHVFIKRKQ